MEIAEYKEVPLENIKVGPYNLRGKTPQKSPSLKLRMGCSTSPASLQTVMAPTP